MATLISKDTSGVFVTQPGHVEIVSRRRRSCKVWLTGDPSGRQFRVGAQIGPIHYRQDPFDEAELYKEIDLDIQLTPGQDWDAAVEMNGYQVRLWQSRVIGGRTVRYILQFRRAGHWLGMAPVALFWINAAGQRQLISAVQGGITPNIDNTANTITWANAFGNGIDFRYNLHPDKGLKTVIVRRKSALPNPTIGTTGLRLVLVMAVDWDAGMATSNSFAAGTIPGDFSDDVTGALEAPDELVLDPDEFAFRDPRDVMWAKKPMAWDSYVDPITKGPHAVIVQWQMRRKGSQIFALFGVQASDLNAAATVYPVYVDTAMAEHQTIANTDDGYSYHDQGSTTYAHPGLTETQLNIGHNTSTSPERCYTIGAIWQTIPIAQGSTIDAATFALCGNGAESAAMDAQTIKGEDADTVATFDTSHRVEAPYETTPTTASASWTPGTWAAGTWYTSPSIASIILEIVSRAGWVSDNNIAIAMHNATHAGDQRTARSYGYAGHASGPKFNCTYTIPATGNALISHLSFPT